ncbi:uncharacterized protein LOC110677824 [Aedes aegypti]|uniref:Uncharacterized protein n=1 Tax=Aedes aegypti TaxID=7159 RepID=A0A6I8U3H4_AEDAE|nr:uncharacterized protein LOC110677824 [Aedes aegypti]
MEKPKKCDSETKIDSAKKSGSLSSAHRESTSTALPESAPTSRPQRSTTTRRAHQIDSAPLPVTDSREERKANGRFIAVCVALFLIFLGIYHAWLRRTAVVAGVIVPVLIMLLYTAWVLYSAKRHKRKMMMLRNAASLNSVNGLEKDSVSSHLDGPQKAKENLQSSSVVSNSQKTGSVRYSNINEIASTSTRSHSKDVNLRKHEQHDKTRTNAAHKPLSKVLPRQQSSITPTSLKEITQQRRLSLDPHMAHIIVKNELDKDRHGSLRSVENTKNTKKSKSNKEKVGFAI